MRTESEIREHVEGLKRALAVPCDCAGRGHAAECRMGGHLLRAAIDALEWAMGGDGNAHAEVAGMVRRNDPRRN